MKNILLNSTLLILILSTACHGTADEKEPPLRRARSLSTSGPDGLAFLLARAGDGPGDAGIGLLQRQAGVPNSGPLPPQFLGAIPVGTSALPDASSAPKSKKVCICPSSSASAPLPTPAKGGTGLTNKPLPREVVFQEVDPSKPHKNPRPKRKK